MSFNESHHFYLITRICSDIVDKETHNLLNEYFILNLTSPLDKFLHQPMFLHTCHILSSFLFNPVDFLENIHYLPTSCLKIFPINESGKQEDPICHIFCILWIDKQVGIWFYDLEKLMLFYGILRWKSLASLCIITPLWWYYLIPL
jgi:hypothetical protein